MDDKILEAIVAEVVEDYQIPPYIPESTVIRAVKESAARIGALAEDVDFENDLTARGFTKSRAYYVINHIEDEFEKNYGHDIRSWQLGREVKSETNENT